MKIPNISIPFSKSSRFKSTKYTRARCVAFHSSLGWLIAAFLITSPMKVVVAQNKSIAKEVESNRMVEVIFAANNYYKDPFNEVTLDVIFKTPGGKEIKVPAFWAGDDKWKVRYSSSEIGRHTFQSICSNPRDAGLHNQTGTITVKKYSGTNELYQHGAIQVAADKRHFEYADGKPFFLAR